MKVLDLCAGSGSATQAFRDRGHDVTTVDIVGDSDIICDVRKFEPSIHYHLIWCSPPCEQFSLAKRVKCRDRNIDLSIVNACLEIVRKVEPDFWIMENPRGCLRYFIGMPAVTVNYSDYGHYSRKPTDLWGVFPVLGNKTPNDRLVPWYKGPRSPVKRAMVPYALSLAACLAIEGVLDA